MPKVLQVNNIEKVYGGGRGSTTRALAEISFDVEKDDYVAIMGPSGSGKTTLLNCIATIDRPTSGSISIDGRDLGGMQTLFYFLLPLALALVHSVVALRSVTKVVALLGHLDITDAALSCGVLFVLVYGAYFVVTYLVARSVVNTRTIEARN